MHQQKEHDLPAGLGQFALLNVEVFCSTLSPEMAALGGVFVPVYRLS